MRMTIMRAAVLAMGVAVLSVPATAQSPNAAGSEMQRNQAPKGNLGTGSERATTGATHSTRSNAKRSHHTRRHHRARHGMSPNGTTTGMGRGLPTPGNPNNTGLTERSRNVPPKGNINESTPPGAR